MMSIQFRYHMAASILSPIVQQCPLDASGQLPSQNLPPVLNLGL